MSVPGAQTAGATPGLRREAARGGLVTVAGQVARMVVQLSAVTILARLLSPDDYGLLAMVVVIVGVGEIFRDFGLSSAAVQARDLSRRQRDNLFWINTGIGVVLGVVVFAGAGLVSEVFGRDELTEIARALSATFVLNGLATQYRADLLRRLRFAHLAGVEIAAAVAALVAAVLLALSGAGYWALVAQTLVQTGVQLLGMVVAARWLPRLPHRAPMRELLRFGGRLVGTQLIGYASNNTDSLIIGLRFGAAPLGIYNRAFHLIMTPLTQLRAPTTTVALPVLARLRDDAREFSEFVLRGQLVLGYTLVAGLGLVAAAAEPVTDLFLGPAWEQVTPLIRLLAAAGIFQTLSYVGYWIYLSRGLTADLLRYTLVTSAIKVTCLLVGSAWGVVGVAVGYAVAPALAWPLSIWWLSRRTEIPRRGLYLGALRILTCVALAAGAAAAVDLALDQAPALVRLAAAVGVTLSVYALAALVARPVRADLAGVVGVIRAGLHRGAQR